jgi:transcriptional regulator with XRE-family HTH domain
MDRRRGELGLSLREIARQADITPETLRAVRRGLNDPSSLTRRGIERALQWTAGSVDQILEGGEPAAQVKITATGTARFDDPDAALENIPADPQQAAAVLRVLLDQIREDNARSNDRLARVLAELDRVTRETG